MRGSDTYGKDSETFGCMGTSDPDSMGTGCSGIRCSVLRTGQVSRRKGPANHWPNKLNERE